MYGGHGSQGQGYGYGGGGGQRPLGKNMSNEEYLERQSEMNRIRRAQEQASKERQDKQKIQEREQGFNVYISGANERRVQEQRQREKYGFVSSAAGSGSQGARQGSQSRRSGSRGAAKRHDSKGARRRWLAPEGHQDPDSES